MMHVSLVGISHRDAPVAVRERFAFAPDELPRALALLGARYGGAAVLSTCNRTEVYIATPEPVGDPRPVVALLCEAKGEAPVEGAPFFALSGAEVARHLFRVAAGIDSMVIGESEILGQVRGAFTAATAAHTHTPALSRLFHSAIRVGRRVRTHTAIGRYAVSTSSTAVALARETLGDLSDKTVLVVGAGEAGKLTAGHLAGGIGRMLVTSRSFERGAELAEALQGDARPFADREAAIGEADIVISSTAAHDCVIDRAMIERVMRGRSRALMLVDIGVPRDVEASVREIPGVHLYDIDELQAVSDRNLHLRRNEVAAAEAIVEDYVAKFDEWMQSLQVMPTVAALRARAEALREAEVARTLARLDVSDEDRNRIHAMTTALVKKLLHGPVTALKTPQEGERWIEAARALFNLDDDPGEHES